MLAAVVLGALLPAGPAGADPGLTAPGQPPKPGTNTTWTQVPNGSHTVTLITGDRVTMVGDTKGLVTPGAGREKVNFVTSRAGGRLRVIPSDALPLLGRGRLDPRLFDITSLVEFGYDDARSARVPLIVTGGGLRARSLTAELVGITNVRAVPGGTAVHVDKASVATVWPALSGAIADTARDAGTGQPRIWLDGKRAPALKESVPQIGASAARSAGFTGAGITVGVVDTGVDSSHLDLAGQVVVAQDFTGTDLRDAVGHGTHVAATIASTGAAPGGYRGVAPGARIASAKVCTEFGCAESAILAGMQWSAEQGAKVVNMSLGGADTPEQDVLEAAVEQLTADKGVLFVIAAGNAGADETIGSPGSADSALTVGAVTKADALASFSSRGPRVGDGALKPDITAPGVDIVAAKSSGGAPGGPPGEQHLALSGTSMATPHVTGAAAILAQRYPSWTPAQLKAALMGSARTNPDIAVRAQGAGRVDVARALAQTVSTEPASVSFGRQPWPHNDDEPVTRTVTYRNTGPAGVTLALRLTGDAPAGVFTLSATSLSVPAGGTASVTLTADTRVAGPDTFLGGHLVASAGEFTVTTPFGVDKEVEHHELTLEHTDRNGAPDDDYGTIIVDNITGRLYTAWGFLQGPATTRPPCRCLRCGSRRR